MELLLKIVTALVFGAALYCSFAYISALTTLILNVVNNRSGSVDAIGPTMTAILWMIFFFLMIL